MRSHSFFLSYPLRREQKTTLDQIHEDVDQPEKFFSLYHDLGEDVPEKIRSTEYRDRIEKS